MQQLSQKERDELQKRQICLHQRAPGVFSRRILIPTQLAPWFFKIIRFDGGIEPLPNIDKMIICYARQYKGKPYQRDCTPGDAPNKFSCSTFTQVIFGQVGIHLPRYSIDQSYLGRDVPINDAPPGSLLFCDSQHPIHDPNRTIGHVAIKSGTNHIIHGDWRQKQIAETEIPDTITMAKAILPDTPHSLVLLPPCMIGLHTALDVVRWLQRPPM